MRRLGLLLAGLATQPGSGPLSQRDDQWLKYQHGSIPS